MPAHAHNNKDEILQSFENWLRDHGYGPDTVRAYTSRVGRYRHFLANIDRHSDTLASKPGNEILVGLEFDTYLDHCSQDLRLKDNSLNSIVTALEKYCLFLTGVEARLPRFSAPDDTTCQRLPAGDELLSHLSNSSLKVKAAISLIVLDGLRISECIALQLDDVHLGDEGAFIDVHDQRIQTQRRIQLNPISARALTDWLTERAKRYIPATQQAVFVNSAGNRITRGGLDFIIRSAGHAANLEISYRVLHNTRALPFFKPQSIDTSQDLPPVPFPDRMIVQ
jgi:hypothetical protein